MDSWAIVWIGFGGTDKAMAIQAMAFLERRAAIDEIMRNLAPPLGAGLLTLVIYVWARGLHRRARTRPEAHPAE